MDPSPRPPAEPVEPLTAAHPEPLPSHEVEARVARTLDRTVGAAVERAAAHVPDTVKPKLRGWLHLGAAPFAGIGGLVLVLLARGTSELASVTVYAVATTLLFTVSATYHRGRWSPRTHGWLKRFDHANIFLLIAGTYTPFTVILLQGGRREALLWIVWSAAAAGVAFRVIWVGAPRWLYVPAYVALGWTAVFFLPDFAEDGGVAVLVLMILGGAFYTVGGLVYALRRPDPFPTWFGFHEVFHAFTLAAYLVQYVAVVIVVVTR
jgi:hemolysin III